MVEAGVLSVDARSAQVRPVAKYGPDNPPTESQGQPKTTSPRRCQEIGQPSPFPVMETFPPRLKTSTGFPESNVRMLNIGIETEFYLATRRPKYSRGTISQFARALAAKYNIEVSPPHPRMRPTIRPYNLKGDYDQWCLVCEDAVVCRDTKVPRDATTGRDTISTPRSPWGIELVSPILKAFPGSSFRNDVDAIWKFLQRNYNIFGSGLCATHVHISVERGYTLRDLKRLAQAIIHFEPAFEALVTPERRGNIHARSNWLEGPGLGRKLLSRCECIAAVERAPNLEQLMKLIQPVHGLDREFAWSFYSLFTETRTVEFRKPPASLTPEDALSWAELAMSFVQAAVRCESAQLQKVPSTIGGLRWYLEQFFVPDMNEPIRLHRLWQGKDPAAAIEPKPLAQKSNPRRAEFTARLHEMVAEDERRIRNFASTTRKPYW